MCDLSPHDAKFVLATVSDIQALAARVTQNASSVADRASMDHEGLSTLPAQLSERAGEAAAWVAAQPRRH